MKTSSAVKGGLDNEVKDRIVKDYNPLRNHPSIEGEELIGDKPLEAFGITRVLYGTKEEWNSKPLLICAEHTLYVYTNYDEDEHGNLIAGFKLGDGNSYLIDSHVFAGEKGEKVEPEVITEDQLPQTYDTQASNPYIGKLVTLKGLKYANQIFCMLYIDSNKEKKMSANRIFLSDATWGVTTWAMSENKFKEYFDAGLWDSVQIGNSGDYNYGTVGQPNDPGFAMSKADIRAHAAAYSVSQYFTMGSREIQLRTSGYSKFGDEEIPKSVLEGRATVDMTGILSLYQGSIQFTVNSLEDIVINE